MNQVSGTVFMSLLTGFDDESDVLLVLELGRNPDGLCRLFTWAAWLFRRWLGAAADRGAGLAVGGTRCRAGPLDDDQKSLGSERSSKKGIRMAVVDVGRRSRSDTMKAGIIIGGR